MKSLNEYILESKDNKVLINFIHKFGSKDEQKFDKFINNLDINNDAINLLKKNFDNNSEFYYINSEYSDSDSFQYKLQDLIDEIEDNGELIDEWGDEETYIKIYNHSDFGKLIYIDMYVQIILIEK